MTTGTLALEEMPPVLLMLKKCINTYDRIHRTLYNCYKPSSHMEPYTNFLCIQHSPEVYLRMRHLGRMLHILRKQKIRQLDLRLVLVLRYVLLRQIPIPD